ncbi:ABC transporter ATP-binding protein [Papillibacter cinnamivorans]|uniref:Fe-S cluster assembly ATP-binding protein n=1 Tax=Papillibacter cinnamivorans DSM 12816 TaxID=1122930 RepID=A0A1W2A421_9FIRM|nr:ATP-binding cassette domain-containing protein [Papillibacter cinnamivorans]SMC55479.1 Fe-S cluster assembly ATP-binding protein [Papillibacter cinnamivorans DSM 12816]
MLQIENLSFQVNGENGVTDILKNVSLTIPDNRFVVITGPNGGGKTTLAKAIMGLVQPVTGSIRYDGTEITGLSVTERARLGISYGFQQPPRFKGLRVQDLLSLAAGKASLSQDECCRYLTQVGLCSCDYLDREMDTSLSGGEIKRIEIATILARNSSLMIFDEPEAGIDLWSFARLTETFKGIRDRGGVTLLIISHQERIIQLADEIVVLSEGELRQKGPRDEIFPLILADTVAGCSYMEGVHQ